MTQEHNRQQQFSELFPNTPAFRLEQLNRALFQNNLNGWENVSTLSKDMREALGANMPWMSVTEEKTLSNAARDTTKAILKLSDGTKIETVLMANRRAQWTVCVSSQVGCAMRCSFCATGKMGFTRNLSDDEIVDQYRYWVQYLHAHPELEQRISNIVFMGMGEPLANYDNVKASISTLLKYTDIGPTHITVSTVGVLPRLETLLTDKTWPHVRLAVSLHSADPITRKEIVPTSYDAFLGKLETWVRAYLKKFGNRRHHLTFEYVMLRGINDDDRHAKLLGKFVSRLGKIKVNLIPYNEIAVPSLVRSNDEAIERFIDILDKHGVTATCRRTMGDDIAAACGQLITTSTK